MARILGLRQRRRSARMLQRRLLGTQRQCLNAASVGQASDSSGSVSDDNEYDHEEKVTRKREEHRLAQDVA